MATGNETKKVIGIGGVFVIVGVAAATGLGMVLPAGGWLSSLVIGGVAALVVWGAMALATQQVCGVAVEQAYKGCAALAGGIPLAQVGMGATDAAQASPLTRSLLEAEKALRTGAAWAEGIFSGMPLPYLCVDTSERALFINAQCLEMLQIDGSPQACLGKTLAELFYNEPERKTVVSKAMQSRSAVTDLDVVINGHKGRKINVRANVFPLIDKNGTVVGGFCLYADMTSLAEAQAVVQEHNERLQTTVQELGKVITAAHQSTSTLSDCVSLASSGADRLSQNMLETSTAMGEMNQAVLAVSRGAASAAHMAEDARDTAYDGLQKIGSMIEEIHGIVNKSEELTANMATLGQQTEGISSILDVISDIADQTNLLALNAAIEAARAGEAGRGFAVVADEVRKLAEKTMSSTQEVGTALQAVQQSARRSQQAVEQAAASITSAGALAQESDAALQNIVSMVDASADQVRTIAAAAEEQSASSEQITASVTRATEISDHTKEAMVTAIAEVKTLVEQADVLTDLLQRIEKH